MLFEHFPYSLDLTPSHYYQFPRPKKELEDQQFATHEELIAAVEFILRNLNGYFYHDSTEKLVSGLDKCLPKNGDYVEKW